MVTRLLALALLTLGAGAGLSYFQLTRSLTEDLTHVALSRQAALADYVAGDVARSLQSRLRTLERLAAALPLGLLTTPEAICPWLRERDALHPTFSLGFAVADDRGRILSRCAVDDAPLRLLPGIEQDVRQALAGAAVIGHPGSEPGSGRPGLPFAVPIRSHGRVSGVLVGTAAAAKDGFLDLSLQGRVGQAGGLLLVSPSDRLFVGATEDDMFFRPTPAAGVNPLHDRAMAGFRGSGTTVNARGVEEISAIAAVPGTGWFVVARSPASDALATLARTRSLFLWNRIPSMVLVLVLVGLLMTTWLRPLFSAARQAENMARGATPLAPLPVARRDEIGHLTEAFNRLLVELGHQREELARRAHQDGLTGLPNRNFFVDRLEQALHRTHRHGTRLAVAFLDLDGFKQINDTLGHEAGDEALKETARRLATVTRGSDMVARLGGDEFVLLVSDIAVGEEASVQTLLDQCIAAISRPMTLVGEERTLGISAGAALSDLEGKVTPQALLAAADRAMYVAKAKKRRGLDRPPLPSVPMLD